MTGLRVFSALNTAFPETQIQFCIVHMERNSVEYVHLKDYKEVTADLNKIYQSVSQSQKMRRCWH
ncbi:transposase [Vibrio parahaemolyticus]|nr:transposase [Vibrio parahaemolyticus]